jgi:IS5 family transposase
MLLAMWYDLSDVKLAEALDDRASFRRYCGFSTSEATPERTTFVRFRRALVAQALDEALFDEITAQLKTHGEARWVKHRGRAVLGFKAHVGADADTALVEEVAVTPANVNAGKADPDALPDQPGELFADSAYRGKTFRATTYTSRPPVPPRALNQQTATTSCPGPGRAARARRRCS